MLRVTISLIIGMMALGSIPWEGEQTVPDIAEVHCGRQVIKVMPVASGEKTQVSALVEVVLRPAAASHPPGAPQTPLPIEFAVVVPEPFTLSDEFAARMTRIFLEAARDVASTHHEHREARSRFSVDNGYLVIEMGLKGSGHQLLFAARCPEIVPVTVSGERLGAIDELSYDRIVIRSGLSVLLSQAGVGKPSST